MLQGGLNHRTRFGVFTNLVIDALRRYLVQQLPGMGLDTLPHDADQPLLAQFDLRHDHRMGVIHDHRPQIMIALDFLV